MKPARESNIELLRILTMLGVVILHYNNTTIGGGLAYAPGINQHILLILEAVAICAVNLFMLITGYFSSTSQKRDPAKILGLVIQVSLFRLGFYLLSCILNRSFSLAQALLMLVPVNYFVILYGAVYLLSPYLNLLLQKLGTRRKKLLALCILLLSVWPTLVDLVQNLLHIDINGVSTISMFGSQSGYTLVNFLLMYMIGACLRLEDIHWKSGKALAVLGGCVAGIYVWSLFDRSSAWAYCNPLMVLEAVALFLLFRNLHFTSKLVNTLSKATFTCYLVHIFLLRFYNIPQAVQKSPLWMVLHILITCVSIYAISWVCSLVYGIAEKPLQKLLQKFTAGVDISLPLEEKETL